MHFPEYLYTDFLLNWASKQTQKPKPKTVQYVARGV